MQRARCIAYVVGLLWVGSMFPWKRLLTNTKNPA